MKPESQGYLNFRPRATKMQAGGPSQEREDIAVESAMTQGCANGVCELSSWKPSKPKNGEKQTEALKIG